ncbi:hypothetical protein B566_EDAN017814 [Ephemera danica]|nr:hypothetical protein B566_EDAN017814 [Ephemera danica]
MSIEYFRKLPSGLRCRDAEEVQYKDTKICTCLNTCTRVEITCLAEGKWSNTNHICSKPIRKCANTVTSFFTDGKYEFRCADGYQQLGGKKFAVCQNGQLNFTDKLRCVLIAAGNCTIQWVMLGMMLLMLGISVAVRVYFHHEDNHRFVAMEIAEDIHPSTSQSAL